MQIPSAKKRLEAFAPEERAYGDMTIVTIHIYLPEEAVDCWYPVQAEHLGDDRYRILEEPENDPVLEFHKSEIVRCRLQKLGAGVMFKDELVAYEISD